MSTMRWPSCSKAPSPPPRHHGKQIFLLCAVVATFWHSVGCAGPTAHLVITAPASAVAGSPITVTVRALVDQGPDTIFNSVVHFTSSDPAAILPADYVFTAADAGSHTFASGVTFMTPGNQTVTATDTATSFLTATTNVTVAAAEDAAP